MQSCGNVIHADASVCMISQTKWRLARGLVERDTVLSRYVSLASLGKVISLSADVLFFTVHNPDHESSCLEKAHGATGRRHL